MLPVISSHVRPRYRLVDITRFQTPSYLSHTRSFITLLQNPHPLAPTSPDAGTSREVIYNAPTGNDELVNETRLMLNLPIKAKLTAQQSLQTVQTLLQAGLGCIMFLR